MLEIGTGLGYQTAVLAELARKVWTIQIVEEFSSVAEIRLGELGYTTSNCVSETGPAAGPSMRPWDHADCRG